MQVRSKKLIGILAHSPNHLPPFHNLTRAHLDLMEVRVLRANSFLFIILVEDVINHHHVAPQFAAELSK